MRAILAALLLTTTIATPALAASQDRDDRRAAMAERIREAVAERAQQRESARSEQRQERRVRTEQREERQARIERRERAPRNEALGDDAAVPVAREQSAERGAISERRNVIRERLQRRLDRRNADAGPVVSGQEPATATRAEPVLRTRSVGRGGIQGQVADRLQRGGVATALADPDFARRWREQWRRDDRHDWRRYRDQNRSLFRYGFYYDPFGYSYRRFGPGYTLWPSYYSHRYLLNDPWQYRLPYVGGSYRWVRYWDDAMLVDLRTGRVVDVIYDFFW